MLRVIAFLLRCVPKTLNTDVPSQDFDGMIITTTFCQDGRVVKATDSSSVGIYPAWVRTPLLAQLHSLCTGLGWFFLWFNSRAVLRRYLGRVVKAMDLKSISLWERRFKPCRYRHVYGGLKDCRPSFFTGLAALSWFESRTVTQTLLPLRAQLPRRLQNKHVDGDTNFAALRAQLPPHL